MLDSASRASHTRRHESANSHEYDAPMRTTVDTDRLGDEIAELAAHLDAATHRLLTLIRRFDEARGWADQGALSCAHWLSWRIGLERGAAREHVRVARAIADLPLADHALRQGLVSYSKVRALTRVATPATEATLVEMARSSTASQLERICRSYRLALRNAAGERPEDEADHRWVRERETEAGLVRFEMQLRPDEAAVVRRALEAAMQRAYDAKDVPAGTPSASLRRADALVAVAEQYLAGGTTAAAPPVEVVVHVDAAALAEPDTGGTFDDHVVPWARGGATALANLCSLCRRHHTHIHDGFRVECYGAGGFRFFRPDGAEVTAASAAPVLPGDPVGALRAQHWADGIAIDAHTGFPRWDGRAVDYEHTVFCLVGQAP